MKPKLFHVILIFILIILIIKPDVSVSGAAAGLNLWFETVLPTLLPFMLCSRCIIKSGASDILISPFKKIFRYVFGVSDYGCYSIIIGLLCGFPMGAKTVSDFVVERKMSEAEGDYLLSVCNHPSPIFLIGFLAPRFNPGVHIWLILLCAYMPIIPIGLINRIIYTKNSLNKSNCNFPIKYVDINNNYNDDYFESVFYECCQIMLMIGGYMMIFTILSYMLLSIKLIPRTFCCILSAVFEITTGVHTISSQIFGHSRNILMLFTVIMGGVSGIMQTKSVIKKAGLSIERYIIWKIIYTAMSCFLYYIIMRRLSYFTLSTHVWS